MPYQWINPDIFINYFNIRIYHVYKNDSYENKLSHWFTTDITEPEDKQTCKFDIRDLEECQPEACEDDYKEIIKLAIENQTLKLPENMKYLVPIGCFDWYLNHPNDFIKEIAHTAIRADLDNTSKLRNIFPHLIAAKMANSWDTVIAGNVIKAPRDADPKRWTYERFLEYNSEHVQQGSFFWYLYRSGSFVTCLAQAIQFARPTYRELIKKVYPQMVASYTIANWHKSPIAFQPCYNAV